MVTKHKNNHEELHDTDQQCWIT